MNKIFVTNNIEETYQVAREILENLHGYNLIALHGELGAGKTTFSQGMLSVLGAEGPFTSPTFVIMKKYDLEKAAGHGFKHIYHFDCYRVGEQDVLDLGWQEIISNPKNLVIVEWPEKIPGILPEKYIELKFNIVNEDEREILLNLK